MDPNAAFHAFSLSHFGALAGILLIGVAVIVHAVRSPQAGGTRRVELALSCVLLAFPFGKLIVQLLTGTFDLQSALPLHYCDFAAFMGVLALWSHRQLCCEITYFFGLAGTLQALITPSLQIDFPHYPFWIFFGGHGAVVITSFYVVLGMKKPPQRGAVSRAMMVMTAYAVIVGALNALLGTNYGFLCAKPPTASLMDHLGPWPWYVGSLWLLALVLYFILDLPFQLKRHRVARE